MVGLGWVRLGLEGLELFEIWRHICLPESLLHISRTKPLLWGSLSMNMKHPCLPLWDSLMLEFWEFIISWRKSTLCWKKMVFERFKVSWEVRVSHKCWTSNHSENNIYLKSRSLAMVPRVNDKQKCPCTWFGEKNAFLSDTGYVSNDFGLSCLWPWVVWLLHSASGPFPLHVWSHSKFWTSISCPSILISTHCPYRWNLGAQWLGEASLSYIVRLSQKIKIKNKAE